MRVEIANCFSLQVKNKFIGPQELALKPTEVGLPNARQPAQVLPAVSELQGSKTDPGLRPSNLEGLMAVHKSCGAPLNPKPSTLDEARTVLYNVGFVLARWEGAQKHQKPQSTRRRDPQP